MSGDRGEAPLPGAVKDEPSVTADWVSLQRMIEGVPVVEVRAERHHDCEDANPSDINTDQEQ